MIGLATSLAATITHPLPFCPSYTKYSFWLCVAAFLSTIFRAVAVFSPGCDTVTFIKLFATRAASSCVILSANNIVAIDKATSKIKCFFMVYIIKLVYSVFLVSVFLFSSTSNTFPICGTSFKRN